MPRSAARPFAAPLARRFALVLAGSLLLALPFAARAADAPAAREATITVSGSGDAHATPDMAIITLSVTKQEASARASLDANNAAMGKVLEALKADGIAARDLQTSGFSIQPVYVYPQSTDGTARPPELSGYQTTNALTIRLRDLARAGAVIDKSVTLGINQGGDIRFTNEDIKPVLKAARENAVKDAMEKAKDLTAAAGVNLGRIIEINESTAPAPVPLPMMAMAKDSEAGRSVPMAPGENTYSASVTITFALNQ